MRKKAIFVILSFLFLLCLTIIISLGFYFTSSVSKDDNLKNIIVEQGYTSSDVAKILKENNIIKSELMFKLFLKIKKVDNIYAASYYMSESMNLNEVIDTLIDGGHNVNEIAITFREGINMMEIARIIEKNTTNTKDDVYNLLKDSKYIDSLIEKYWFLTDSIKDKDIYYPLEGYLFPDTYFFSSEDVEVSLIFKSMLDQMEVVLNKYQDEINVPSRVTVSLLKKQDYEMQEDILTTF